MESGLAALSSSLLRTHSCVSSGPMDLCTFRFLRQSRTCTIQLVLQQVTHQVLESGLLFPLAPSCHTVVHAVLQLLDWGTTHPFTEWERQCWAVKLAFLLSNTVRAETTKSYVSIKRNLDVKSIKPIPTRQKTIWIVFCLSLFISKRVNTLTTHITAVLHCMAFNICSPCIPPCMCTRKVVWEKRPNCRIHVGKN